MKEYEKGRRKVSEQLLRGFKLSTCFGATVTIEKYLDEGGQGFVYEVIYKGEKKALKWYKKEALGSHPQDFYNNLKNNVQNGAPSKEFLWPIDLTEWTNGTFGYVMDLRPAGYYEVTDFMLCHVRFASFKTAIDAALHIVSAFRILHNKGYSYQDINDGNFFINPRNGRVLICDNDNVAPEKTDTGILGKPRYMAPEIVMKKNKPDSLSDRFSMSIILYILFSLNHPLEGKKYLAPALPPAKQEELYGSNPVFMMDSKDKSNAPHPVIHRNSIAVWACLPQYMKDIFLKAFSKEAFINPNRRPKELDWLKELTKFRSEIIRCSCGNEIFTDNGLPCKCEECGKQADIKYRLQLREYSIPAVKDTRIYRCQLGVCNPDAALDPIALIIEKKNSPGVLGIRNKTENRWDALTPSGASKKVEPNDVIPLKNRITFTIDKETIEIKSN